MCAFHAMKTKTETMKTDTLTLHIVESVPGTAGGLGTIPPIPFTHLHEASRHYRQYIEDNGYGARDVRDGLIVYKNKVIARISYNGKVWRKWTGPDQLLYDPYAGEV